jgi:hypothetical protein
LWSKHPAIAVIKAKVAFPLSFRVAENEMAKVAYAPLETFPLPESALNVLALWVSEC